MGFFKEFWEHTTDAISNWSESDLPVPKRLVVAMKNRGKSVFNGGCCGNLGQPGC